MASMHENIDLVPVLVIHKVVVVTPTKPTV